MLLSAASAGNAGLLVPAIAAAASIIVALISAIWSAKSSRDAQRSTAATQKEVEELKNSLAEQTSERNARRDYEYAARKRLYEACEPVLFSLIERSFDGYHRILNLVEATRRGDVRPDGGWLASQDSYYSTSTIYRFMAPMVLVRLLQEQLTAVDLRLDRSIGSQYSLGKLLAWSFTDAFELARIANLSYDPYAEVNDQEYRRRLSEQPEVTWQQGLTTGRLENAVEEMIDRTDKRGQVLSYGKFSARYHDRTTDLRRHFDKVANIFDHFHPDNRPVFWLIMVTHAHIYRALIRIAEKAAHDGDALNLNVDEHLLIPADERTRFDWRRGRHDASDNEVLVRPFDVAEEYLRQRLGGAGHPIMDMLPPPVHHP